MAMPHLKHPFESYQPRFTRFLEMLVRVRGLKPYNVHLWHIMDSVAFQDTETALEVALLKETSKTNGKTQE